MAYSRTNQDATVVSIDRSRLYAEGNFKYVYKGTYIDGRRRGQACVSKDFKTFKTGSVYADHHFDQELDMVHQAQKFVERWNEMDYIRGTILMNSPEIGRADASGLKVLVEPFIANFEKFNSNSGWVSGNRSLMTKVMQALSHFSYHSSRGELLLCDLQGGMYEDGCILTDPIIMSRDRAFGPGDLGAEGIRAFFQRHVCNQFCRSRWSLPGTAPRATVPMRQGTSMLPRVPERQGTSMIARVPAPRHRHTHSGTFVVAGLPLSPGDRLFRRVD